MVQFICLVYCLWKLKKIRKQLFLSKWKHINDGRKEFSWKTIFSKDFYKEYVKYLGNASHRFDNMERKTYNLNLSSFLICCGALQLGTCKIYMCNTYYVYIYIFNINYCECVNSCLNSGQWLQYIHWAGGMSVCWTL